MMSHLKDYITSTGPITHFLTYGREFFFSIFFFICRQHLYYETFTTHHVRPFIMFLDLFFIFFMGVIFNDFFLIKLIIWLLDISKSKGLLQMYHYHHRFGWDTSRTTKVALSWRYIEIFFIYIDLQK